MTTIRADLRATATEIREFEAEHRTEFRVGYLAAFVIGCGVIVPDGLRLWFAVVVLAASCAALVVDRLDLKQQIREVTRWADKAEERAETFADEILASHAANEILTSELAHADATITTLAGDNANLSARLLEAETRQYDVRAVEGGVVGEPVRLSVVPEQRDGAHDHLADDDAWFSRLYDDKGELR